MLKWSARAFAVAAALQFGVVSAQESSANLIPPGPAGPEIDAQAGNEATEEANEALGDVREQRLEAQEELQDLRQDAAEEAQDRRQDAFEQQQEGLEEQPNPTEREARFRPDGSSAQVDERIRAATANLDIDDETRSRYRWHNGEWWFKTRSGNWKFYRDSRWQDFDPTTYQAAGPGMTYGSPQAGYRSDAYGAPQQFSGSDGYYAQGRPYQRTQPYSAYRPNYDGYNRGYYNDGFNNRGYGYNQGYYGNPGYGNPGYGNPGYGNPGYNPATDRIQGYDNFGRPYSMSGDRYRGGVIGSEIGGRIGGNTGAIIGGALGAEAAD